MSKFSTAVARAACALALLFCGPSWAVHYPAGIIPPEFGEIWSSTCGAPAAPTQNMIPGEEQLRLGRYWDPQRKGHGWDFFWYIPAGSPQTPEHQQLFVSWYTHRKEADGQYRTIWYGAVGSIIPAPGDTSRRAGFEGELYEFTHAVRLGADWGLADSVSQLQNSARKVGWVRLAFSPSTPSGNETAKVGVWWRFNEAAGQNARDGSGPMKSLQCLWDFGPAGNQNPGEQGPMQGLTGNWVPNTPAGWSIASYFHGTLEYQLLLYFQQVGGSHNTTVPRWVSAHRFFSVEPNHACANRGYEAPQGTYPSRSWASLCMFEARGYAANGEDMPAGGWDHVERQFWRGTLRREYSASDGNATFQVINTNPDGTQSADPIPLFDHNTAPLATGAAVHKITNLHEIRTAHAPTPGAALTGSTAADHSCQVHTSGAAQGFCDLRLYWITNGFPSAAVYMENTATAERVLVRDIEPITPIDGYPYPPRGAAATTQVPGGIAAGDTVVFKLYTNRNRTELLASSGVVTGTVPPACGAAAIVPSGLSPNNNAVVSPFRPTFRFSMAAGSRYRIRLYRGATFLAQYDAPAIVGAAGEQTVELPAHVASALNDPTTTYTWKVRAITACGQSADASATFRMDAPVMKDAPPGPTTPSHTPVASDPLVGEIPLNASVQGGAAAMSIPIEVAPGRHGMQPALSLDYSSRGGNGLAGMGWSLSGTSSIHRCPRTAAQDGAASGVRLDATDKLCLDGQRLMRMTSTEYGADGAWYRTEIDSGVRVRQIGALGSPTVSFEVMLKGGEIQRFGWSPQSRNVVQIPVSANGTETRVLSWHLERRLDRAGNAVDYSYQTFGSGELLPVVIRYTSQVNVSTNATIAAGSRRVTIEYELRPHGPGQNDLSSTAVAGARVDQTRRIRSILVEAPTTNQPNAPLQRARSYTLVYTPSAHSGRSLLRSVQVCGSNAQRCLPRAVFQWQEAPPAFAFSRAQALPSLQQGRLPARTPGMSTQQVLATVRANPIDGFPGTLGGLRPVGDLDGDGVVDFVAAVLRTVDGTSTYETHLVKMKADRTPAQSYRVPTEWASEYALYGENRDLNNDGRSEVWGMRVVQSAAGATAPGTYPYYSRLRVHGWKPGPGSGWEGGNFESIELPIIIASGRKIIPTSGQTKTTGLHSTIRFADVNGDGKPDLFVQRQPYGPSDPLQAMSPACPTDEGLQGARLLVYLNTSPDATLANLQFGGPAGDQVAYSECVDSNTIAGDKFYASLGDVPDLNGDGVPDLRFKKIAGSPTGMIAFGQPPARAGDIVTWPAGGRVAPEELSPDWSSSEGLEQWIDVNGDGLDDYYSSSNCDSEGDIGFLRLNTGRAGKHTLLTRRMRIDGKSGHPGRCTLPIARPNAFSVATDIDSDGRAEVLRAYDFASRVCTRVTVDNDGAGGPVEKLACPPHPSRGDRLLPQFIHATYPVVDMYEGGFGDLDDSVYRMAAHRFTYLGPDAEGSPRYRLDAAGDAGVLMNANGTTLTADLHGDGLTDSFGTVAGCRFAGECELLNDATPTTPPDPTCAGCSWGPATWPDASPIRIDESFFYVSENLGVGSDPSEGAQPRLPDLLRSAATLRDGDTEQRVANRTTWHYAPLSNAGRSGGNLPLYTIPARGAPTTGAPSGYIDAEHFYFTSSMPVVSFVEHPTAIPWSPRIVQYGYQEAMYHNRGRGFTGFRKIIQEDLASGLRTTQRFQQKFPFISRLECEATSLVGEPEDCPLSGTQAPISRAMHTWEAVDCGTGACAADRYVAVRKVRTVDQRRTVALPRMLASQDQTRWTYDAYSNVLLHDQTITAWAPAGASVASVGNKIRITTFRYAPADEANWWVDQLTATGRQGTAGYAAGHATRSTGAAPTYTSESFEVYDWDPATRQINCTARFTGAMGQTPPACSSAEGAANWQSTSRVTQFDTWGNPRVVTVTGKDTPGNTTRTVTTDYAASTGYFPNSVSNPLQPAMLTDFDLRFGQPLTIDDSKGLRTTFQYDELGRETAVIAPVSGAVRSAPPKWTVRQWCSASHPCTQLYRVITEQPGTPTVVQYFDPAGNESRVDREGFDGRLVRTERHYNERNLLVAEIAPAYAPAMGAVTYYAYDALGRVTRKESQVDDLSGASPVIDGVTTRTAYTYVGNRTDIDVCPRWNAVAQSCEATAATVPPRLTMSRTHDSEGLLLRTVDAAESWTSYWYDTNGNVRQIEDAKNALTTATYDGLDRRTAMSDPSRGNWTFSYNGFDELRTQVDGRGLALTYVYDQLGRKFQRYWREPDAENTTVGRCMLDSWTYDDARGGLLTSEKRERVASLPTDSNCPVPSLERYERTYDYADALKRMSGNTTSILVGAAGTPAKTFTRYVRYDAYYGRVKQEVLPEGVSVYREYNPRGYPLRTGFIEDFFDFGDARNRWLTQVEAMTERDQVTEMGFFNNSHRRKTRYNASRGLPLEICVQLDQSACTKAMEPVQSVVGGKMVDVAYRYDAYANVIRVTQYGQRPPRSGGNIDNSVPLQEDYVYDRLMRLTEARQNYRPDEPGQPPPVTYGYDAIGNLLTKSNYSVASGYVYGNPSRPHQVTRVNLRSGGFTEFTYDGNGNLARRTASGSARELRIYSDIDNLPLSTLQDAAPNTANGLRFRYGPDQQRFYQQVVTSFSGEVPSKTYYVDKSYEREEFGGDVVEQRYYLGDGIFVIRDNRTSHSKSGTYFSHGDRLGSAVATTSTSGTLAVYPSATGTSEAELRQYDAFGKVRDSWGVDRNVLLNTNPRGFTQHEHLDKVSLIHMNGRAYDPNLGRFLGVDPFIQFPSNSQSLNPYSYIMNNPLAGTDPSGYVANCGSVSASSEGSGVCSYTDPNGNTSDVAYAVGKEGLAVTPSNGGNGAVALSMLGSRLDTKEGVASLLAGSTRTNGSPLAGSLQEQGHARIASSATYDASTASAQAPVPPGFGGMTMSQMEDFAECFPTCRMDPGPDIVGMYGRVWFGTFVPGGALVLCAKDGCGATEWAWSAAGVVPALRGPAAVRGASRYSDALVKAAQKQFPGKAGKIENHHVKPKYLGGAANGRTVPIDAAYHQQITNEFRRLWPYGQGTPSAQQLETIMQQVYEKYPLPGM